MRYEFGGLIHRGAYFQTFTVITPQVHGFSLHVPVLRLPTPSRSLAAQNNEGYYEPGVTTGVECKFANPQDAKILRF